MARLPVLGLLAVALAACSGAQLSPANAPQKSPAAHAPENPPVAQAPASKPDANAVDPAAIKALKDMGASLQSLKEFEVGISLTGERVLQDGQKLQHTAVADLDVVRPNKLRATMRSARLQRDMIYDGETVTLYQPEQKYYSQAQFSDNLNALVDRLGQRYGIEVPSADLFLWGTPAAPVESIESAMNAGQDFIAGDLCDHYAFRQGQFDWQIWISTGARPLPRKLVITSRADDARPQSITYYKWNLNPKFGNATFAFRPPAGAKAAEFVPLKSR